MALIEQHQLLFEVRKTFDVLNARKSLTERQVQDLQDSELLVRNTTTWHQSVYEHAVNLASDWVKCSEALPEPYEVDPPRELRGNYVAWRLLEELLEASFQGGNPIPRHNPVAEIHKTSKALTTLRAGHLRSATLIPGDSHVVNAVELFSIRCIQSREALMELRRSASEKAGRASSLLSKGHMNPLGEISATNGFLSVTNIKGLYAVSGSSMAGVCLAHHLDRVQDMLTSLSNIVLMMTAMSYVNGPVQVLKAILKVTYQLIREDPEYVGEAMRGARNVLAANLAGNEYIQNEELLLEQMDDKRRKWSQRYIDAVLNQLHSKIDALNILNLYKAMPHLDANMYRSIQRSEGVRDPHPISLEHLPRFEGTLRKNIFLSLTGSRLDIRLSSGNESLMGMVNNLRRNMTDIKELNPIAWVGSTFQKSDHVPKPTEVTVSASDKSSAPPRKFSREELREMSTYMTSLKTSAPLPRPPCLDKFRPVNDVVTLLKGVSELDQEVAFERFRTVVSLHEEFEERYPGLDPEEIPSEELEEFVRGNKNASYLVMTEPKVGEKHKTISRIFYMAEQLLKVVTQSVERVARQISRKQMGVSIVKSYSARRSDLENFCYLMKANEPGRKPLFISFDMEKFSMKFNMRLLRIYGTIMAELTGEESLRRLDIVFRSSLLLHNTRGMFYTFAGVRGGFEGFFNFIWSSIHASVMDIALQETGLSGVLLAYSDDGLLNLMIPEWWCPADVRGFLMAVKRIYSHYGLEFHLGKTIVSSYAWEFLGDFCLDGRILPSWVKEASALGVHNIRKGLTTIASMLQSNTGQAASLVKAGAPELIASFCAMRDSIIHVTYRFPGANLDIVTMLSMVPYSLGGYRTLSAIELAIDSGVPSVSEFTADLELTKDMFPAYHSRIMYALEHCLSEESDVVSAIATESWFRSSFPDTSGLSAVGQLIQILGKKFSSRLEVVDHPLTESVSNEVLHILSTLDYVSIPHISRLLMATPQWKAYTSSVALVKSTAAVRLLSRREIRRAQGKDTRSWTDALNQWSRIPVQRTRIVRPLYPIIRAIEAFKPMRVLPPILPMRMIVHEVYDEKDADITTHTDIRARGAGVVQDVTYHEPLEHKARHPSALAWHSEEKGVSELADVRRLLATALSVIRLSPASIDHIRALVRVFGYELPTLDNEIMQNVDRVRAYMASRPDVVQHGVRLLKARTTCRIQARAMALWESDEQFDRNNPLASCRSFSAIQITGSGGMSGFADGLSYTKFYQVDQKALIYNTKFRMTPRGRPPLARPGRTLPSYIEQEMNATMEDEVLRHKRLLLDSSMGDSHELIGDDILYADIVAAELVELFRKQLAPVVTSSFSMISPMTLSYLRHREVCVRSLTRLVSSQLLANPTIRSSAMMQEGYDERIADLMRQNMRRVRDIFERKFGESSLISRYISSDTFDEGCLNFERILSHMRSTIAANALSDMLGPRRVSLYSDSSTLIRATAERVSICRENITEMIIDLYNKMSLDDWKGGLATAAQRAMTAGGVDEGLSYLIAAKSSLHQSAHRYTPFNIVVLTAEMYKLWAFSKSTAEHMRAVGSDDTKEVVSSRSITWRLSQYGVQSFQTRSGNRPDVAKVLSQPLLPSLVSRARYEVHKFRTSWRPHQNRGELEAYQYYSLQTQAFSRLLNNMIADNMILIPKIGGSDRTDWERSRMLSFSPTDLLDSTRIAPMGSYPVRHIPQPQVSEQHQTVLFAHLATLSSRLGTWTYQPSAAVPSLTLSLLTQNRMVSDRGPKVAWCSKEGISLFALAVGDDNDALCAMANIHRVSGRRAIVTSHDLNGSGRILLGAAWDPGESMSESLGIVEIPDYGISSLSSARAIIDDAALSLGVSTILGSSSPFPPMALSVQSPDLSTGTEGRRDSGGQLVVGKPWLVASSIIAHAARRTSQAHRLYAVSLLISGAVGSGDPDSTKLIYNKLVELLTHRSLHVRNSVVGMVAPILSWLGRLKARNPMSEDPDILNHLTSHTLPADSPLPSISTTSIHGSPRGVDDVISRLSGAYWSTEMAVSAIDIGTFDPREIFYESYDAIFGAAHRALEEDGADLDEGGWDKLEMYDPGDKKEF